MVTEPEVLGGVYTVVHVPESNVHEPELKLPPAPPSLQLAVPVGVDAEPTEMSATVAV